MIRYFVHRGGRTELFDRLDPAWLLPDSGAVVWADVAEPTEADGEILRGEFGLHQLAVEAAIRRFPEQWLWTHRRWGMKVVQPRRDRRSLKPQMNTDERQ